MAAASSMVAASARAMAAEKRTSEHRAISEDATKYADDLWIRASQMLGSGRGSFRLGPPFLGGF